MTLAMINTCVELSAVSIHSVLMAASNAPTMTTGFLPTRSETHPDRYTAMASAPAITMIMRPNASAGLSSRLSPGERKAHRSGTTLST